MKPMKYLDTHVPSFQTYKGAFDISELDED